MIVVVNRLETSDSLRFYFEAFNFRSFNNSLKILILSFQIEDFETSITRFLLLLVENLYISAI